MIKYFALLVCLSLPLFAADHALELKVGDVLLQPLKCWACTLIEEEEDTIFSHVGVVIAVQPQVIVAEAFGNVRSLSFTDYDKKTEVGQKIKVLRFQREDLVEKIQNSSAEFLQLFQNDFEGAAYDHNFRWNNFDEQGVEKYYCSELVAKMFQAFAGVEIPLKRMHFDQNREGWMTFFKGDIPDHEWGVSPADFDRSELFHEVGEL